MPALDDVLQQKIALLASKNAKRELRQPNDLITFASNDYFGLSQHPQVIEAAKNALDAYGAGAGASRLAGGNHALYAPFEAALAKAKHAEAALVFGSGYLANMGIIPALVGAGDLIIADKYIHACMIDAARLSGADMYRFAHNNLEHCEMLLSAHRADHQHCIILTETVFSMDGDRAPIAELKALADKYDAWLMSDDAHGFGVIEQPARADIQMGTLSKSLGTSGGYVAGCKTLIDYLTTASRTLIYSTALPPSIIASAHAALDILEATESLREKPLAAAQYFTQLIGAPLAASAIVPVILGENEQALKASKMLEAQGYCVPAIRPPTVPENTARLRFAFNANHQKDDIERVATLLLEQGLVCAP